MSIRPINLSIFIVKEKYSLALYLDFRDTIFQRLFAAEFNLPLLVNIYNFYLDFVTFLDFVRDAFDASVANLRDMNETIRSRKNFYKGAKIDNFLNLAEINLTNFHFLGEIINILDGLVCRRLV